MDSAALSNLMNQVARGELSPDEAVNQLRSLPFNDLGYARVDHHRELRQGRPEAIYGPGKTPQQCAGIVAELLAVGEGPVILSRADQAQIRTTTDAHPGATVTGSTAVWRPAPLRPERVTVVTAGTADLPVATECAATLEALGFKAEQLVDVGVAGIHRILGHVEDLQTSDALVVVAGMEGALASVVGGLSGAPVVAVPTSVGYGSSLEGVTALLGMLASCASGLVVVGIDNGFGAAQAVARILPPRSSGAALTDRTREPRTPNLDDSNAEDQNLLDEGPS